MERNDVSIFSFFLWYAASFDRVRLKHSEGEKEYEVST